MEQSQEIRIERLADQVKIKLPTRQLGEVSRWGWALIAVSIVGFIFMFFWISMPLREGIQAINRKDWGIGIFLIAFASTGFFAWRISRAFSLQVLGF